MRKLSYALLALAGIGAIIFWGRVYWKEPGEKGISRFPILPPAAQEKGGLPAGESRPDLLASVGPNKEPEEKPSAQATEAEGIASLSAPASTIGGRPSDLAARGQIKTSPSAPALGPKKVVTERIPAAPISRPPAPKTKGEAAIHKVVFVRPGDSIYTIAEKNYRVANTSIVDHILDHNPKIANPNKLLARQEIRLPALSEESLLLESPDGTYRVRLGTFLRAEYATFLKDHPVLKGRELQIIPRRLPTGETWYRVVAGKFSTREEGLSMVEALKKQGLSPYFPGFRKARD